MNKQKAQKMLSEAQKYLGYKYVWGGSSPQTSFDCSGYVYWVVNNSKVGKMERTNAYEIFQKYCKPIKNEDAKAGDFVFFSGTYDCPRPISHLGIYIGNGAMLHCGEKFGVEYIHLNNERLKGHFHSFARPFFLIKK